MRTTRRLVAEFAWPEIDGAFNWAIDWFDEIARDNSAPALVILEEDGERTTRTFDELATRSDQLGHWLLGRGVRKGDAVLLMLGNQVELWESMLALTKIGAVILPTTLAIGGDDLQDRIVRGSVTHVIAAGDHVDKFDLLPQRVSGVRVGDGPEGWADYDEAFRTPAERMLHPEHARDRPAAALLHLRHDQSPEAGGAHARLLPGRSSHDDVLAGSASG